MLGVDRRRSQRGRRLCGGLAEIPPAEENDRPLAPAVRLHAYRQEDHGDAERRTTEHGTNSLPLPLVDEQNVRLVPHPVNEAETREEKPAWDVLAST